MAKETTENLFGKSVIYTDADGKEHNATITGPVSGAESKKKGKNVVAERVHTASVGQHDRHGALKSETKEIRSVDVEYEITNAKKETTRISVTGVRRQDDSCSRKCWRPAAK